MQTTGSTWSDYWSHLVRLLVPLGQTTGPTWSDSEIIMHALAFAQHIRFSIKAKRKVKIETKDFYLNALVKENNQ